MKNVEISTPWVKSGKEILDLQIQEVPMLLHPIFPKYGVVALAGSSDLGKSFLLLQLACAIVEGRTDFLGFTLNASHQSAIYLSTEDDEYSLCPRLLNLAKTCTDSERYDNLKVMFESTDLVKRLETLLKAQPADVVMIDTFSDIFDGDMNQSNKVRSFIQKFKNLSVKYNTLIVFNHHCGKKNDYRAPHKDNLLGSQGFESSMRAVIELRKDFNEDGKRHLCIVKGNYLPDSFKSSSFCLSFNYQDGFRNTGQRVSFDKLAKSEEGEQTARMSLEERIHTLRASGMLYSKIAAKVQAEGFKISRSTVGDICKKKKRPTNQLPLGKEMDGQAA